jgi:hypothetical protein
MVKRLLTLDAFSFCKAAMQAVRPMRAGSIAILKQAVNATEQFNVRRLCLVQSKIFVISVSNTRDSRGTPKMISRKIRFITAAAALALLASVAVARTVHTHTPSAAAHVTSGKVTTPPTDQTASPHRHGVIVCGMANDSDCEKLEMLLPM